MDPNGIMKLGMQRKSYMPKVLNDGIAACATRSGTELGSMKGTG